MVRKGKFKIHSYMMGTGYLYDLENDPFEVDNLWDDPAHLATKADMLATLLAETLKANDPLPRRENPYRTKIHPKGILARSGLCRGGPRYGSWIRYYRNSADRDTAEKDGPGSCAGGHSEPKRMICMKTDDFDAGWHFRTGRATRWRPEREALVKEIPITLPHDFTISADHAGAPGAVSTGYYACGYGIYTKSSRCRRDVRGQTVLLSFDGVYKNCYIMINGQLVTSHPYGYTAFQADLTDHLWFDRPNRLEVTVNNSAEPNSRWYIGSGIYRSLELLTAPPLHIAPWGIFARTDRWTTGTAQVVVEITSDNTADRRHV